MHDRGEVLRRKPRRHSSRRLPILLAALASAAIGSAALAAPGAGAAPCANEAFRAGSPQLADCRAYELVSPVDMNGNGVEQIFGVSPDGGAVAYGTVNIFGGEAPSSMTGKWVARRGADWSTATLNPATTGRVPSAYDEPVVMDLAADFSSALLGTRYPVSPLDQAPYISFPESGNADVYQLWPGGRAEWVSHGPNLPATEYIDRALDGASADLSQVLFQTREPLTLKTKNSAEKNLYERAGALLRTVNLDENGQLLPGAAATGRGAAVSASFYSGSEFDNQGSTTQGQPFDPSAVSRDGSRVFFTAPLKPSSAPRQLYVRIGGAETIELSKCHFGACDGGDAPDGAMFLIATPDGSAVTFYSSDQLTEAASPTGGIYRYDLDSGALSLLAPLDTSAEGLHHGGVLAASADGAYLYLCEGGEELAVYHDGEVRPLAPVPCDAAQAGAGETEPAPGRSGQQVGGVAGITQGEPSVTPDAGYVFTSTPGQEELEKAETGGYASGTVEAFSYPSEGHSEVYYYDAGAERLRCLSCRPDGDPAAANSFLDRAAPRLNGSFAEIPTPVSSGIPVRHLTASGQRAFFVSDEALAPGDENGNQDVYEWELAGSGECTATSSTYDAVSGGCLALVSSGDSPEGAVLEGVSETGGDVFFASYSSLVPIDSSTELHLYDARVGGGIAAQFASPPPACGDTKGCRGDGPAAPLEGTAASAHFNGPGNRSAGADCGSLRQRAQALHTQARRARAGARRARKHDRRGKAKRMEHEGRRLATRADRLARQAKQCASPNRGAAK